MAGVKREDMHGHICDDCLCMFIHDKAKIKKGSGHWAHKCPSCGRPVNRRVELFEMVIGPGESFIEGWYGPQNLAAYVEGLDDGGESNGADSVGSGGGNGGPGG